MIRPRKSKSVAIAGLVAATLTETLTMPVQSKLAPKFDMAKINEREITTWPAARRCEMQTRQSQRADYEIAICILERLQRDDDEDRLADELLAVVESIGDQMVGQILLDQHGLEIEVLGYEHEPLYDRPLLESHRIFGAAIALQLTRDEDLPAR